MTQFLALFITGIVSGGIYAILSSGLVLTYSRRCLQLRLWCHRLHGGLRLLPAPLEPELAPAHRRSGVPAHIRSVARLGARPHHLSEPDQGFRGRENVTTIGVLVAHPVSFCYSPTGCPLPSELPSTPSRRSCYRRDWDRTRPRCGPSPRAPPSTPTRWPVFVAAIVISVGLWIVIRWTRLGLNIPICCRSSGARQPAGDQPDTGVDADNGGRVDDCWIGRRAHRPVVHTRSERLYHSHVRGCRRCRLRAAPVDPHRYGGGPFCGAGSEHGGRLRQHQSLARPRPSLGRPFVLLFVGVLFVGRDRDAKLGRSRRTLRPPIT